MLSLSRESIKNKKLWEDAGIALPEYDYEAMCKNTIENPTWVHFGAGNIFRGFIGMLAQRLLNSGKTKTGIIAVETYDYEIIDKIYKPYDNLSLQVVMNPDGKLDKTVAAGIAEGIAGDTARKNSWDRLKEIFRKPSLQMASFTITEKGYNLKSLSGDFTPQVQKDIEEGPKHPENVMAKVAALIYERFKAGELPIAIVSMDNCSHNGEKLFNSINTIVRNWAENKLVENEFVEYVNNPEKVSFPWSMIDKITPRPSNTVAEKLKASGFGDTDIVVTDKHTYIAPFVNTEKPQYLVIEDKFPNGRMPLEDAGVYFTDRETVEKVERMKVCTCLNPLHTSMAIFGCLLGYKLIADEMKDSCITKLINKIGYDEGMPVVTDPKILNPKDFIKEVIEVRLPNPNIPDTPQRIVTDTSQKVGIRFGETIKAYCSNPNLDVKNLKFIPLVIAGWLRYLMGVDDNGNQMPLSSDPLLDTLRKHVSIKLGDDAEKADLKPILSNADIFGSNLYEIGLGEKVEGYFAEMIKGTGAVRNTLKKYLD